MPRFNVCCKPGDVYYCKEPHRSPKKVRRYKVLTILICDYKTVINCEEDDSTFGASFSEKIFKRIMYKTKEEAEQSIIPDFDREILELKPTPAFCGCDNEE